MKLPELGVSEFLNGQDRFNNKISNVNPNLSSADSLAQIQRTGQASDPTQDQNGVVQGASGTANAAGTADDIAYLNDQAAQLRSLLARTDTGLNQGLLHNQDEYDTQVGATNQDRNKKVSSETQNKLNAYETINRNANNGYRSLAQIIGRAAGRGSSAFQDLLPDVIGKDMSSKRQGATSTYGQNVSNIEDSTSSVLADLLRQKKANEESLRSGIEGQRQNIQSQLAANAAQAAQARGGGYAAVKAAQQPFQDSINQSRDQVENFFNQFRTAYTPQAINPNLSQYSIDRATINAQNQPDADPNNPYAQLLRKRLQGQA